MATIMISTILVSICIGCFACVGLTTAISMIQSIINDHKREKREQEKDKRVLVPEDLNDTKSIERAKKLLSPIHFGKFTICDYDRHDAMIAFTSQMAHVVSNAYVKSPTAKNHDGFSAGSYKDLTRVAWLNETMWTELFLENKKHLIKELDYFITALQEYKTAMENDDAETLKKLLADGKHCKEEIDGITGE